MAVLGSTTLTGCLYIEDFLGGADVGIGTTVGYKCVFNQTDSPTSWTKELDLLYNNIALRVVSGAGATITNNGFGFTQAFAPRSISGLLINDGTSTVTLNSNSITISISNDAAGTSQSVDGSLAELPLHDHGYQRNDTATVPTGPAQRANITLTTGLNTGQRGGDGQHNHTLNLSQHTHTISSPHNHPITGGTHPHSIDNSPAPSLTENFSVLYKDVIIARKDLKP